MRYSPGRAVASFLILFLITISSMAAEPQLLRNGGLDGEYIAGAAKEWKDNSGWADVTVEYSPDRAEARHGIAQKIKITEFRSGAAQFTQSGVSISKGGRYEITIWMKGELDSPVEILLRKHGGPYTTYVSKSFKVARDWQEYKFTATSPVNDPAAFFMIRLTGAGTLWVDDASMRDVGARVSTAPSMMGNLIPNGSFEAGLDRWGVEIRESGGYEYELPVEMAKQKPEVVSDASRIGKRSLKIVIPEHGRFTLTPPYVRANPGRKYSLSLWMAADKPRIVRMGIASGYFGAGAGEYKNVQVGRVWERFSISDVLQPAQDDAYYITIESEEGGGTIWIDGVQFEEGDVSSFASRNPVEIGLERQNVAMLYSVGAPISLGAVVSSSTANGVFFVTIKSIDYYGKSTEILNKEIRVTPDRNQKLVFLHPSDSPGYFKIIADVRKNGEVLDSSEMTIGILPKDMPKPHADSPFGNHARFNVVDLENARKLGISWLRMHPPLGSKWAVVEKNKGQFVFHDSAIRLAKSLGFNILGSLDTTPKWASMAPRGGSDNYRSYPPKDLKDWGRYVYETVSHYKGIIDYWEVWNEPDSTGFLKLPGPFEQMRRPGVYADLLKVAYTEAKRANPDSVIVGGAGTGQPPTRWVEEIFARGAYDYMDVLSYHFYTDGRPGDALDTPTSVYIGQLKALMRKYGKGSEKPIWESESGIMYPESAYRNILQVSPGYPLSGKDAAAYIVRNYVHLLSSGVSKWFYYSAFVGHRIDRNEATGFFEWDGSPRPLAIAYANLSWILGNAGFNRNLELPGGVAGAEFRDGNRIVNVFWATEWSGDRKVDFTIPNAESYSSMTVYDLMGNVQNKNMINNKIAVTKEPIYVVLTK